LGGAQGRAYDEHRAASEPEVQGIVRHRGRLLHDALRHLLG
jgi:hypothetical protein